MNIRVLILLLISAIDLLVINAGFMTNTDVEVTGNHIAESGVRLYTSYTVSKVTCLTLNVVSSWTPYYTECATVDFQI